MKENEKSPQGYEFILEEKDVLERVHFGRFEVVKTRRGMMFKTYTGYHVWVSPWTVGTDGKAHETSLYQWLDELLTMEKMFRGHEEETVGDTETTKGDLLEMARITTEANLISPLTAFIDRDHAAQKAVEYMDWQKSMMKTLQEAAASPAPQEDLRADAEAEAAREAAETMSEELKTQEGNE